MSEYYEIAVNSADRRCSSYAKYLTYPEYKTKPDKRNSQIIESFRQMVESSTNLLFKDKSVCFDNSFLYRFLYARKFDCSEAMDLLLKYIQCKQTNAAWQNINVFDQKIKHALLDGNPGVLRERDRRGRKVITFTAANWNTQLYSLEDIYRAFLLTLDTLLEETQNQALGFVVIVDWTDISYQQSTHLNPTILKSIIEGLQDLLPVKFKGIHFISQPWYVELTLTAIKPFFKDKIRKRIHAHGSNLNSMHQLICKDILPPELGGEGPCLNNFDWFHFLVVCSQTSDPPKLYRISKTIVYTKSPLKVNKI